MTLTDNLRRLPGTVRAATTLLSRFVTTYPPGSFYSPIPAETEIPTEIDKSGKEVAGIDMRETAQLELLRELARYHDEIPFAAEPRDGLRFHFDNEYYSFCDATVLYAMLRHFQPKRVIEVGSGFSSAVMLDTRDRFFTAETHLTFIDPYPERLESLLRPDDHDTATVLPQRVQEVDLGLFDTLEANDFLFVDSSHVVKLGSDVAHILFTVLPRLAPGVVIHFHDIPWPFEYPLRWINAGRAWNEAYALRAFLQYNDRFPILFFNDFVATHHGEALREALPAAIRPSQYDLTLPASSLWITRR